MCARTRHKNMSNVESATQLYECLLHLNYDKLNGDV